MNKRVYTFTQMVSLFRKAKDEVQELCLWVQAAAGSLCPLPTWALGEAPRHRKAAAHRAPLLAQAALCPAEDLVTVSEVPGTPEFLSSSVCVFKGRSQETQVTLRGPQAGSPLSTRVPSPSLPGDPSAWAPRRALMRKERLGRGAVGKASLSRAGGFVIKGHALLPGLCLQHLLLGRRQPFPIHRAASQRLYAVLFLQVRRRKSNFFNQWLYQNWGTERSKCHFKNQTGQISLQRWTPGLLSSSLSPAWCWQ